MSFRWILSEVKYKQGQTDFEISAGSEYQSYQLQARVIQRENLSKLLKMLFLLGSRGLAKTRIIYHSILF